jgi:PAS domain S-box-containing protein
VRVLDHAAPSPRQAVSPPAGARPVGELTPLVEHAAPASLVPGDSETSDQIQLLHKLLDHCSDAIFVVDPVDGRILDVNQTACQVLGYTRAELLGLTMMDIEVPYDDFSWPEQVQQVRQGSLEILEVAQRRKSGETFPVEVNLKHIVIGKRSYVVAAARDITETKQLEAKFLRAQRLESIGRLAGGIAHDLNNVLCPVILSIQLLREKMPDAESLEILNLLENSARRGTGMIKQVLTFAKGLKADRIAVHIAELIKELVKIGRETFPRSIQIKTSVATDLWPVIGDATQLHQVLMNLCVNACDAMPDGGVLELRAENQAVDEKQAAVLPDAQPGPYVVLSVKDTGIGIPPEIQDKIFEPFFTTKQFGKGTGLGLPTVLGIAKGHGGFVGVESALNLGSCFRVYLPSKPDTTVSAAAIGPVTAPVGQDELILVVDDEKSILLVTQAILIDHGYNVITANDGVEAVALYKERQAEIRAVVTDMAMPYMDGVEAIRAIRKIDPQARFVAVSGFLEYDRLVETTGCSSLTLLHKPYSPDKLLQTLAGVLGKKA